jgi:hypothetical protein
MGHMRVIVPLAVSAIAVMAAGVAWACECTHWRSDAAQLAETDVAFVGEVVRTARETGPGGEDGNLVTEFTVSRTLKGPHRQIRRIAHYPGPEGGPCGIDFRRGAEVLVLAGELDERLYTSSCHRPQFPLAAFERAASR